ncbi:hypothetical protein MKEN_01420800 [Mycena kentingensis (nom. inval.)]|nr:hypothetical protein MKEN_01420800 [Mycena kentingensis (nom. inval.)]
MSRYLAIFDDADPAIEYTGAWSHSQSSDEFLGTVTNTDTDGSTASFSFKGTSVNVYGSVNPSIAGAAGTELIETYSFIVDGNSSTRRTYTPPTTKSGDVLRHLPFYQSPPLVSGHHELKISVQKGQGVMFLDYLTFDTAVARNASAILIDDRDARVVYQPTKGWGASDAFDDMMQTSQMSSEPGAGFSLQFEGKAISYWGSVPSGNSTDISISIDGGPPTRFVQDPAPASLTHNTLIYSSGALADGNHTLVATAQGSSQIHVDFFLVTPSWGANDTNLAAPSASPSSSTSWVSSGARTGPPAGVIVGGTIAGLIVMVVLALLFRFLRRRRKQRRRQLPRAAFTAGLPVGPETGGALFFVRDTSPPDMLPPASPRPTPLHIYIPGQNPDRMAISPFASALPSAAQRQKFRMSGLASQTNTAVVASRSSLAKEVGGGPEVTIVEEDPDATCVCPHSRHEPPGDEINVPPPKYSA